MTGRNRAIAVAGLLQLGDGLDAVLKLLPPERREAIARHLEIERGRDSATRGKRMRTVRKREQQRIEKVVSIADADPRLMRFLIDRLVLTHGRD